MSGPPPLVLNTRSRSGDARAAIIGGIIPFALQTLARESVRRWPGYAPTPLHDLQGRAGELGVARLAYKDEAPRFGLKSFKALGGGFAVQRHLQARLAERIGRPVELEALLEGHHRSLTEGMTVAAATDGNHGRAVAWGARLFGCGAAIFIHETVSPGRERAIASFGAAIRRVPGVYEDALRACAREAVAEGWAVISDTAYPGCMETPRTVMAGYTVMVDEAVAQWHGNPDPKGSAETAPPTHVFVQAGVGGLAAAVAAGLHHHYGSRSSLPRIVVVEPERADCCFQSARLGRWAPASGDLDTLCAGLACGEPSLLAWDLLDAAAFGFMTVDDAAVVAEMRRLASPPPGDAVIVAGESAPCGLAGLAVALGGAGSGCAAALGLSPSARVMVFGSEGDTDPDLYQKLISSPSGT